MIEFKDREDRTWKIDLNIGNVLHVRRGSQGKFDLLDPTKDTNGQPLQVLLWLDLLEFWEMLWLLVESQATAQSITADQFGQSMAGDCLIDAQGKFFTEWQDFFHSLHRPDAALAVESQANIQAAAVRLVTEKVKLIDTQTMRNNINATVEKAVSAAYGKAQASLDAALSPTPGDSST